MEVDHPHDTVPGNIMGMGFHGMHGQCLEQQIAGGFHAKGSWPRNLRIIYGKEIPMVKIRRKTHSFSSRVLKNMWSFPKMGLPLVIINFNGLFKCKPAILGIPHVWKAALYQCRARAIFPRDVAFFENRLFLMFSEGGF